VQSETNEIELSAQWSLTFDELTLISNKPLRYRLGFGAQLKFFQLSGRFADRSAEIPASAARYLAEQIDVPVDDLAAYGWTARSGRRHHQEILAFQGIRRMTRIDRQELVAWLERDVCPTGAPLSSVVDQVYTWCLTRKAQSPSAGQIARIVRSVVHNFEASLLGRIAVSLNPDTITKLEEVLVAPDSDIGFNGLKADPGSIGLDSVLVFARRLSFLRSLRLPHSELSRISPSVAEQLRRRVGHESAWEMRRHRPARRLGLLAIFLAHRERTITDSLVDLLIETVHKFSAKAERKVIAALTNEIQKVYGKERLLVLIAEAAIAKPDDVVREVIFPVADEGTLSSVIREYRANGTFHRRVYTTMRASYSRYYRRMLPDLLASTNETPIFVARDRLKPVGAISAGRSRAGGTA
jgi:hypothetical protein